MTFRIEINGSPIVDRLNAAERLLSDLTPINLDIGEFVVEATRQRFSQGRAPDGSKWLPKTAVTLQRYRDRGDGNRPDPLIGASRRLSTEILNFVTKEAVEVGSNLEYAGVMQTGAAKGAFGRDSRNHPLPWGAIPARVWLGLSESDELAIIEIVDDHLSDSIGGS